MPEIFYLSELQSIDVNKSMNELYRTTILGRQISGQGNLESITYYITDFAKDYMSKRYPLDAEYVRYVNRKLKRLTSDIGDLKKHTESNEFGLYAIDIRTPSDRYAAKLLTDALGASRIRDFAKALSFVSKARSLSPNWHEVYRISAFIKATSGDLLGSEEDYETGLSIEPKDPRLLFYFAQFLLFELEDVDKAQNHLNVLQGVRPGHLYTTLLESRIEHKKKNNAKALSLILSHLELPHTVQDERIIYTDALSILGDIIRFELRYTKDTLKAMAAFDQLASYFGKCVSKSIADARLIKNFSESLYLVVGSIQEHEIQNSRERVLELFNSFKPILQSSSMFEKLENRILNKFVHSSSYDEPIIYTGTLLEWDMEKKPNYRFISWQNGNIFAGRHEFVGLSSPHEWRELTVGRKVEFELGSNHIGLCAVRVRCL